LRAKRGSRGKIHDLCCQGFRASSASQRRTVDADGAGAMPLAASWRASSGQVQRARGVPFEAGISHARALTPATMRAGNTRGLPGRGAPAAGAAATRRGDIRPPSRCPRPGPPPRPGRTAEHLVGALLRRCQVPPLRRGQVQQRCHASGTRLPDHPASHLRRQGDRLLVAAALDRVLQLEPELGRQVPEVDARLASQRAQRDELRSIRAAQLPPPGLVRLAEQVRAVLGPQIANGSRHSAPRCVRSGEACPAQAVGSGWPDRSQALR
jgi:hypothetical protein